MGLIGTITNNAAKDYTQRKLEKKGGILELPPPPPPKINKTKSTNITIIIILIILIIKVI